MSWRTSVLTDPKMELTWLGQVRTGVPVVVWRGGRLCEDWRGQAAGV